MPDGRIIDDYYQVRTKDFALIVASTVNGEIIMERHYRHGVRGTTCTLPAGGVEPGEDPLEAAKRELLEETGYVSDAWQRLGSFVVSINYGCGTAHIFKAEDARRITEPDSKDLEEMEILCMKPGEVIGLIKRGELSSISSAAAIGLALNPLYTNQEGIE